MKFDPKKSHGIITGHAWARYEQDGVLYDSQGHAGIEPEIIEEVVEEIELPVVSEDFTLNNAKDFLSNILADGPLARSVIFKECNANNQNWDAVKTAFADMGGEALTRRNVIHWKLKTQ